MDPRIKLSSKLQEDELTVAGNAADAVRCFRLLSFAGQRLRYLFDKHLRDDGLTMQQGVLLSFVRAHGRPTLGETARSMATSHQNAKQVALAVARKGLIEIVDDADDRRSKRLVATKTGQRGWQHRNAEDFAAIGQWFAGLSPGEQKKLAATLIKLIRHLQRADA
jgi:DNA-binding MarR family transcriptional regulator